MCMLWVHGLQLDQSTLEDVEPLADVGACAVVQMAQYYELVVYTDQLPTYADPILDRLDPQRFIQYRLYRDSTQYVNGKHVSLHLRHGLAATDHIASNSKLSPK